MQLNLRTGESRKALNDFIEQKAAIVANLEHHGWKYTYKRAPRNNEENPANNPEWVAREMAKEYRFIDACARGALSGWYKRFSYTKGKRRIMVRMNDDLRNVYFYLFRSSTQKTASPKLSLDGLL